VLPGVKIDDKELPDVKFVANEGWKVEPGTLISSVTRAPTHEPYPYHNRGVAPVEADTAANDIVTEEVPPDTTVTEEATVA
jgi:hypothetical protein